VVAQEESNLEVGQSHAAPWLATFWMLHTITNTITTKQNPAGKKKQAK